jgi:hypothetical protein
MDIVIEIDDKLNQQQATKLLVWLTKKLNKFGLTGWAHTLHKGISQGFGVRLDDNDDDIMDLGLSSQREDFSASSKPPNIKYTEVIGPAGEREKTTLVQRDPTTIKDKTPPFLTSKSVQHKNPYSRKMDLNEDEYEQMP